MTGRQPPPPRMRPPEEIAADRGALLAVAQKPTDWPDKCANCGADWTHIGFDYADGFNCRACGASDADE